jgi:predicted 3-demethylubiquinone-9 3-methyltransferase (glyoxalase superfamily)
MKKITPCLWFDGKAEAAATFYVSVFRRGRIGSIARFGEGAPGPKGSVMTVAFQIEGQDFLALNGGPHFTFTPAISFIVDCKTQKEVDELWEKLTADGGEESPCAWLKDKFGVSWQIVPRILVKMLRDKDAAKAKRVMQAMLQMRKIDIAALKKAYAGKGT